MTISKKSTSLLIRNFTFGLEDSLISTVGLIAGIAVAGVSRNTIVLTGLVLVFVEASSMGIVSLLSEESVEEYEHGHEVPMKKSYGPAGVMFLSYMLGGIMPLLPFLIDSGYNHLYGSVIISLSALFALGAINAWILKIGFWRDGFRTLSLGGLAIMIGVIVGRFVSTMQVK